MHIDGPRRSYPYVIVNFIVAGPLLDLFLFSATSTTSVSERKHLSIFLHEESLLLNYFFSRQNMILFYGLIIQLRPVDEREDFAMEMETIANSSLPSTKIISSEILNSRPLSNVAYSRTFWRILNGLSKSVKVVIFCAKINILLPFGPLSIILHFLTKNHVSQNSDIVCICHFRLF